METSSEIGQVVTKLGCINNCDFCITKHLFDGKFTRPFFTPQQMHDKIIEYRKTVNGDLSILFCETQAIIKKEWWYDLFDLFNDEPEEYSVMAATSIASLKNFDFNRISNSSLRFFGFNVGIETFSKQYEKNIKHLETKVIIDKLTDYGIATYATMIIGFDHQTRESIWNDIYRVVDLDIYGITVHNLKVLPETPLWDEYKKSGRLLDVPNDFYYLEGFQAFTHPYFKPGFEDMLPLTYEIYEYIDKERGPSLLSLMQLYNNIPKQRKSFKRKIRQYKKISKALFPSWKQN